MTWKIAVGKQSIHCRSSWLTRSQGLCSLKRGNSSRRSKTLNLRYGRDHRSGAGSITPAYNLQQTGLLNFASGQDLQPPSSNRNHKDQLSHLYRDEATGREWQVGDVVTVLCEEFSEYGLLVPVMVNEQRLFAPMGLFPSLGPQGQTKSHEEIVQEFEGTVIGMEIIEFIDRSGSRKIVGSPIHQMMRKIVSAQKNGDLVKVWVYEYSRGGLLACYQGLRVFVPRGHLLDHDDGEAHEDLANKYVEKFIDVSIMEVRNCCLSGSMIYHLLELKSAQVGDVVTVTCQQSNIHGFLTSVVVNNQRLFAPYGLFPRFKPGGQEKSSQEMEQEFKGAVMDMELREYTNAKGERRMVASPAGPMLRKIFSSHEIGETFEVKIHGWSEKGLESSYDGFFVLVPWQNLPNQNLPNEFSESPKELAERYVGKTVRLSFAETKKEFLIGSMVYHRLKSCQVGDVVTVPCEEFNSYGLLTSFRANNERLVVPYFHFPRLLPNGRHKTPQDLESEFKGTEIDVVVEEDDMSERKGKIIGNAASILAEELMKTEKSPVDVRIYGHDDGGLLGSLKGIFVLIPWSKVSTLDPSKSRSRETLIEEYIEKDVQVTLIKTTKRNGLVGRMTQHLEDNN